MCPHPSPRVPENIAVQVDDVYLDQVDAGDLGRAVTLTLEHQGASGAEVTLVISTDEAVHALNRQYRQVDSPTDVLSFPAQAPAPGFISAPEETAYLGDIVIAFPYAQRQALEAGHPVEEELRLLAVHGTLHLLGYDHAEPEEEAEMWAIQDAILVQLAR